MVALFLRTESPSARWQDELRVPNDRVLGMAQAAASVTFGRQHSVATVYGGRGCRPESHSPPPVPISSIVVAPAA